MPAANLVYIAPETGRFVEGERVEVSVEIVNTGEATHEYFVGCTVHGPDGSSYDNDGTTGDRITLRSGEQDSITVGWSVEPDAPIGEYDVQIAVWEQSDIDNLDNRLDEQWNYAAFVVEEEQVAARITQLDPDGGSHVTGETVDVSVDVANTGTVSHKYFVGYTVHGPDGREYDNDETTGDTIALQSDDNGEITVSWRVESDAPPGVYDIQIAVWEESDIDNLDNRLDEQWEDNVFTIKDEEVSAEITEVNPATGPYSEGDDAEATVEVENTGDLSHEYFVGYTVHGPDGGEYDNDRTIGDTLSVSRKEQESITVTWTVDASAPAGRYDVQIAVWEETDRDGLDNRLDEQWDRSAFKVTSEPEAATATIRSLSAPSGLYAEGMDVTTEATIENTGQVETEFFVGYTVFGPDGEGYDNDRSTGSPVFLRPDEDADHSLSWTTEPDCPDGWYDVRMSVWRESDRDELDNRLDDEWLEDAFRVDADAAERNASIDSVSVDPGVVTPDETVTVSAEIENIGLRDHEFVAGMTLHVPNGTEYDTDGTTEKSIQIDAEERSSVDLEWTVEQDIPAETYDVQVSVWSRRDSDGFDNRLDDEWISEGITVEGQPIPATLEVGESPAETFEAGDRIPMSTVVRNEHYEEIRVDTRYTILGPENNDWESVQDIVVEADSTREVEFEWTVDETASAGAYDVRYELWPSDVDRTPETRIDDRRERNAFDVHKRERGSLIVRAQEFSGEAARDVLVQVTPDFEQEQYFTTTERDGVARFEELPTGEYELRATAERLNQELVFGTTVRAGETEFPVQFDPAEPVDFSVFTDNGQLYTDVSITLPEIEEVVEQHDDDLFRSDVSLPDGPHEIQIRSPDGDTVGESTVQLGEYRNVVLEVDIDLEAGTDELPTDLIESENPWVSFAYNHIKLTIASIGPAQEYGITRGFYFGLVELGSSLEDLLSNPLETLEALKTLVALVREDPAILKELVGAMIQEVQQEQHTQNPFSRGSTNYQLFRTGWYEGYGFVQIVSLLVADKGLGKVTKVVRSSKQMSRVTSAARNSLDSALSGIRFRARGASGREVSILAGSYNLAVVEDLSKAYWYLYRNTRGTESRKVGEIAEALAIREVARDRDVKIVPDGSQMKEDGTYLVHSLDSTNSDAELDITQFRVVDGEKSVEKIYPITIGRGKIPADELERKWSHVERYKQGAAVPNPRGIDGRHFDDVKKEDMIPVGPKGSTDHSIRLPYSREEIDDNLQGMLQIIDEIDTE